MIVAHWDCFSGISGNMALGAVIDAGASVRALRDGLRGLGIPFSLSVSRRESAGLWGTHVRVIAKEKRLHHRGLPVLERIISRSGLPLEVQEESKAVFRKLAAAEAKIHGINVEEVHFHEVGALDALVDVTGTVLGLHLLKVERLTCSPLPLGTGEVQAMHGTLPVPAPATLELLKGLPVRGADFTAEMVTPTGAALVATLTHGLGPLPAMRLRRVGHGLGDRTTPGRPNILRLILGEDYGPAEEMRILEATIDDMNPEYFECLQEKAREAGALEGMVLPGLMKKNRPGHLVRFLVPPDKESAVIMALLNHSTTLGVRSFTVSRTALAREIISVDTPWGEVRVKKAICPDGHERLHPEYDDLKTIAQKHDLPLLEVERRVLEQVAFHCASALRRTPAGHGKRRK